MIKVVVLSAVLALAQCHDLAVGKDGVGKKIFDENRAASPTIWRRADNVTVNATDNEVISRIVVTDLRPEKDGDVNIVEGGAGEKNVTIELKSPTTLRGYEFHIEVYSAPDGQVKKETNPKDAPLHPSQTRVQRNPEEPKDFNPVPPTSDGKKISTTTQKTNDFGVSKDINVNENNKPQIESNAENVNDGKLKTNLSGTQTPLTFDSNVPALAVHNIHARDVKINGTPKTNEPQTATPPTERSGNGPAFNPIATSKDEDTDKESSSLDETHDSTRNINVNRKFARDTQDAKADTKVTDSSSTRPINKPLQPQDINHDKANERTITSSSGVIRPPSGFVANPTNKKTKRQTFEEQNASAKQTNNEEEKTLSYAGSKSVIPQTNEQNYDDVSQTQEDGRQNSYNPPSQLDFTKDVPNSEASKHLNGNMPQNPVINVQ